MPDNNGHPIRIMRSRKRGSRQPAGAIYVGRPTLWGNPFTIDRWGHQSAIGLHKRWLTAGISALRLEAMGFCPNEIDALERRRCNVLTNLHRLHGHDLACWCPLTSPCHADLLLALAPQYAEIERIAA